MLADLQICISVPLSLYSSTKLYSNAILVEHDKLLNNYQNLTHPCLMSLCENAECQKWKHTFMSNIQELQ